MRGLQPPASAVPLFLWLLGTFPTGTSHWSHLNLIAEKCGVQLPCSLPIPCSPRSMFPTEKLLRDGQGWISLGKLHGHADPPGSEGYRAGELWGAPAPQLCSLRGVSLSCSFAPCLTAMGPQHQVSPWHECSHGSSVLGKMWGRILGLTLLFQLCFGFRGQHHPKHGE